MENIHFFKKKKRRFKDQVDNSKQKVRNLIQVMEIGLEGNSDKNVAKVGKKLVPWRGNFKI